jgi:phospholipid-binding lipoprotein MlaA
MKKYRWLLCVAIFCLSCGCATKNNLDPYEGYNRFMFKTNTYAFEYAIGPVVLAYDFVTPDAVQTGVANFFNNTFEISHAVNDLLQADPQSAGKDVLRFVLNTVFGVFGLFDVAKAIGLEPEQQNFGLTLAYWGWERSAYLVLPVIGPSTVRDTIGLIPDVYLNPMTYSSTTIFLLNSNPGFISDGLSWGLFGLYIAEQATIYIPSAIKLTEYADDPYVAVRNAYFNHVDTQINLIRVHEYMLEPNRSSEANEDFVPSKVSPVLSPQ